MNSPNKLPLLKTACKLLVNNLRKEDLVSIVVYAGAAGLVLPPTKGTDKNADKAIRGILREEGKLIISLSNEELIQMLMLRENNDIPSDYLSNKLDQLLIDLEK